MDFIIENNLEQKKIVFLDYELNYYEERGFWWFNIYIPTAYSYLFEEQDNTSVNGIFTRTKKIILETDYIYFVLDNINKESLVAFDKYEAFYFRFYEGHKQKTIVKKNKIKQKKQQNILNVLSCNPLAESVNFYSI